MRRGLVGHEVGPDAAGFRPAHQFRHDLRGVAQEPDGHGLAARAVLLDQRQRVVDVARLLVQVARAQAEFQPALLALDVERNRAGEARRQRLRPAHPAQARGEDPAAFQVAAVVLPPGLGERLVGALDDALAGDVDPAARRHLAVHHQALAVEFVEMLPGRPFGHEVGIGDQHPRRVRVGAKHAHRLARLHQQRLVVVQVAQHLEDLVVAGPVARGAADAAVDHQVLRVLGHVRVEVVLDHAVGRLGDPALATQFRAARRADHAGGVVTRIGNGGIRLRIVHWILIFR